MKRVTHKTAYKIYSDIHYFFVNQKFNDWNPKSVPAKSPLDAYTDAQLVKVIKGIESGTQQNSEYLKRTGLFPYILEPHTFYTWLKEEVRNRKINKLLFF